MGKGNKIVLSSCPCGKVPKELVIAESNTSKWAWVCGDCCNEWHVEFRTKHHSTDSKECMSLAVAEWNLVPHKPASQWVSVKTPPEKNDDYLVYFQGQRTILPFRGGQWHWGDLSYMEEEAQKNITHWFDLPPSPTKKG